MHGSLGATLPRAALALAALALAAVPCAAPHSASAQGSTADVIEDSRALFPQRARIETWGYEGLVRVPLPTEVLSQVRADLSDLRVFIDDTAAEFLIEANAPERATTRHALLPLDVRERTTGDAGRSTIVETWDVVLPTEVPGLPAQGDGEAAEPAWRVAFGFNENELVRELTIHRVDARGTETEVLSTTLFRLAAPQRDKVEVPIPTLPGARLRLRVSGAGPALRPTLWLVSESGGRAARELRVELEVVNTERTPGVETVLTLRRPRGVLPDALLFETESGAFHREVTVEDAGVGGQDGTVGRAVIYRIPDWDEQALEVPLGPTGGDLLRVRIADQDAPPLTAVRVLARVRQPALVFEAFRTPELFFGGARATRPSYGLAYGALRQRLPDVQVSDARVIDIRANPRFRGGPVLGFVMRPGATVDAAQFSHALPLRIAESREGLTRVRPSLAALSVAQAGQFDFRVVDAENRQWPYLVSEDTHEIRAEGNVSMEYEPTSGTSTYTIALPAGALEVDHIVLDVEDSLFRRSYRLLVRPESGDSLEVVSDDTLTRFPGSHRPLIVPVAAYVDRVVLRVENGDDRPLTVLGATFVTKARDLFLAAPPGQYRLLVGSATAVIPSYDIESARELMLSLRAEDAALGELAANPAFAPPSPSRDTVMEAALMAVLAAAVLLLGFLTFRLVRNEPEEATPTASAEPAPSAEADEDAS